MRRSGVNDEADRERPLPTPSEPFRSLTERSTALAQSHQFEHVLGTSARPQRTALLDADPLFWDVPKPDHWSRFSQKGTAACGKIFIPRIASCTCPACAWPRVRRHKLDVCRAAIRHPVTETMFPRWLRAGCAVGAPVGALTIGPVEPEDRLDIAEAAVSGHAGYIPWGAPPPSC